VDSLEVGKQHHTEESLLFKNVYPTPDPPVSLHVLRDRLAGSPLDPLIENTSAIGPSRMWSKYSVVFTLP
jgi:hypothetical protein